MVRAIENCRTVLEVDWKVLELVFDKAVPRSEL